MRLVGINDTVDLRVYNFICDKLYVVSADFNYMAEHLHTYRSASRSIFFSLSLCHCIWSQMNGRLASASSIVVHTERNSHFCFCSQSCVSWCCWFLNYCNCLLCCFHSCFSFLAQTYRRVDFISWPTSMLRNLRLKISAPKAAGAWSALFSPEVRLVWPIGLWECRPMFWKVVSKQVWLK